MEAVKATTIVTNVENEVAVKGKAEKKTGKRIGFNYIILKSLKESKKNDVVKCLYIKSLVNFGICVIKEGTKGDTKDRDGRDIQDRLKWQKELHKQLQDKVRLPRYLGEFEENGNYYLVIERIKGKSLHSLSKHNSNEIRQGLITGNKTGLRFLKYMIGIVDLLAQLHENGIAHRDVSANNFMIMPSGKIAVIDMELSYSWKQETPSPPFQLGTFGYMSPQQEKLQPPSPTDDIFSVGAILLQVWTGIWPTKLTQSTKDDIRRRVDFFVPDRSFAEIIVKCLDPVADNRPSPVQIKEVINNYINDFKIKKTRPLSKPVLFTNEDIAETIQRGIGALSSELMVDEERGWFSENKQVEQNPDKRKIIKAWYASFNIGMTGPLFFLSDAKKAGFNTAEASTPIQRALTLIEEKYLNRIDHVPGSLHFGSSGIAASLANAIQAKLFEPQASHFQWIDKLIRIDNDGNDLINGIAGQGLAHWLCADFLQGDEMYQRLQGYASRLLVAQDKTGMWIVKKGKKSKATRGFTRGAAGIIYFLLEYAMQYQDRDVLSAAIRGLDWLSKIATRNGKAMEWRSSTNKKLGNWLEEGAPGIALAFLKGYSLTGVQKYKQIAVAALSNHPPGIISNDLGQVSGLSGLGEVYLQAAKILGEDEWMERAGRIAQVLLHLKKEHETHGPYWLVRHERHPLPEFMNGNSGILHFLARYLYPNDINFPFFSN